MPSRSSPRVIESPQNSLIKQIRRTIRSGELLVDGFVILETPRLVEDALASGSEICKTLVSADANQRARSVIAKLPHDTEVYEIPPGVFSSLASTETAQGILALARAPEWKEADLFHGGAPFVLIVASVQDPGNLGTIVRSAEAFGASGILLTVGTVHPYNAKVVRATAGSLLRVPMLHGLSPDEALAMLSRHRVPIFSSVVEGGLALPELDLTGAAAIAIGSEGAGLPTKLADAGQRFTIPIASSVESLNAGAAAAIVLYEAARQRKFGV
jgi:TrmH family RNA methyltransferase